MQLVGTVVCCVVAMLSCNSTLLFFSESTIPTDVEQATGLEKKEIDALMAGLEVGYKPYWLPDLHAVFEYAKREGMLHAQLLSNCKRQMLGVEAWK